MFVSGALVEDGDDLGQVSPYALFIGTDFFRRYPLWLPWIMTRRKWWQLWGRDWWAPWKHVYWHSEEWR
jgi:hypothetical protein